MQTKIAYLGFGDILLICPIRTEERLTNTCFRGANLALAGNFEHWESIEQVCDDDCIMQPLLTRAASLLKAKKYGAHHMTLHEEMTVGWESTDDLSLFSSDELEEFEPNSRTMALRVINPSKLGRKAPKTNELTIIFKLVLWRKTPIISILSLYPGEDIGELAGNITEQTKRVFYDWDHPGE